MRLPVNKLITRKSPLEEAALRRAREFLGPNIPDYILQGGFEAFDPFYQQVLAGQDMPEDPASLCMDSFLTFLVGYAIGYNDSRKSAPTRS